MPFAVNLQIWILALLFAMPGLAWSEEDEACRLRDVPAQELATLEEPGEHFKIRLKNGFEYELAKEAPANRREQFDQFTPEEKNTFYHRRHELLKTVARTMAFPRTAGGFAFARDKVRACLGKAKDSAADRLAKMSLKARGFEVIKDSLLTFDALIWEDALVLVKSKEASFATFLGVGSGLAALNYGYYVYGGVQMDVGYNFETQKRFVQFSWVKQHLKGAVFCFEQLVNFGFLRQYQLDPSVKTHKAMGITIPPVIGYQRGDTMLAGGAVLGLSATDALSGYLAAGGDVGLAGAIMVTTRIMSSLSLYWTDMTKKTAYKLEFEKSYSERLRAAWKRWFGGGCDGDLKP